MEDVLQTANGKIPRGVFAGVNDDQIIALEQNVKLYGVDMGTVTVSTIHSIKGGEADTVVLLQNTLSIVEETEVNDPDEERRVWYVAATRAKTRLIITKLADSSRRLTSLV
jgi:superfamily I DNA/RNA helicase